MTQVFDGEGNVLPVTLIEAKPTEILEIISEKKSGYNAIKVKISNHRKFKTMEFRSEDSLSDDFKIGQKIKVSLFSPGDKVLAIGISKGKGFAGTIKRYHFAKGPQTHGSNQQRRLGSIGAAYPQHVLKGQRMPGRMGGERITVKNLEVIDVDPEKNILLISGAIPGNTGGEVKIISK